ncbi:hypothetical protein CEP52_012892 [Fusarium oligoseptatum]|uniref:Uncharacterized protein n=1 Tax=Fusarium oligoseptatum TaxID=2604345 RepID=A0A428SWF4_9HYPO|nr:hypothetical protein CEP52_012892 [Fusarium oligoseptatum]
MLARRTSASLGQAVRGQQQPLRSLKISSNDMSVYNGQRWMSHWRNPAASDSAMRLHLRLRLYGRAGPDNAGKAEREMLYATVPC